MGETQSRLVGLDALRGIAALCVLLVHVDQSLLPRGILAVDLFFMLSGFVMARTYEARLQSGLGPLAFLKKRYRRLLPAYAVGCTVGAVWLLHADFPPLIVLALFVPALLFLPTPIAGYLYPYNGPGWSLTWELLANVLHALVFAHMSTRALVRLLALLAVALAWIGFAQGIIYAGAYWNGMAQTFCRALVCYGIGIVLFRRQDLAPAIPPIIAVAGFPVILIGIGALAKIPAMLAFDLLVCPLLVWSAASGRLPLPRLWLFLGAMSYPLYALHVPVLQWIEGAGVSSWWGALLALVLAGMAAMWPGLRGWGSLALRRDTTGAP